jgi:hypothetical protein
LTSEGGQPLNISSLAGNGLEKGVISSLKSDGTFNPAALNIEFDIPVYQGAQGGGDTRNYIRVWGLSLKDISQGMNFNGQFAKLSVGMSKGFPLADPSEQGAVIDGEIMQAYGNWIGTDMTLDMHVMASSGTGGGGTNDAPWEFKNFAFTWKKGEQLGDAIKRTIQTALPDMKVDIQINSKRVADQDQHGDYKTFTEFSHAMQEITIGKLKLKEGVEDNGISIYARTNKIIAIEGTTGASEEVENVTKIKFQDLLGQVTWADANLISVKLVMRGNLSVSDVIEFPAHIPSVVQGGSMSGFGGTTRISDSLGFSGQFRIKQMQHWGNFRQPDAMSWNTTVWAFPL